MLDVHDLYSDHAPAQRERLLALHDLIQQTAANDPRVGRIALSLKWGQLSFATVGPKSGTPIRISGKGASTSLFVPCSTTLIERFRQAHPERFDYHGQRELRLPLDQPLPVAALRDFVTAALTYYCYCEDA